MNDTRNKAVGAPDEVNVAAFFAAVGRAFLRVAHALIFFLALLRNLLADYRRFFALIVLVGLAIGFIYAEYLKRDYYKSTMVLNCDYLNDQVVQNIMNKLNLLAEEDDKSGLSEFLSIDLETAENIRGFESMPFVSEDEVVYMEVLREQLSSLAQADREMIDEVIRKLQRINRHAYYISVYVFDPDVVKPIEHALIEYFRNNEFISRRIAINKATLENRKAKLTLESRKLDSLKKIIYHNYQILPTSSRGSGNVFLGDDQLVSPLAVFKEDLAVYEEILAIERLLYLEQDFEVVDGFTTFRVPESASTGRILAIALVVSWIMGYVILAVWELDKYLSRVPTNESRAKSDENEQIEMPVS